MKTSTEPTGAITRFVVKCTLGLFDFFARSGGAKTATEPTYVGYDACPGSHRDLPGDSVDANDVANCPVCHKHVLTGPVGERASARWWRIERHRSSVHRTGHSHACIGPDGDVDCVCDANLQRVAGGWW